MDLFYLNYWVYRGCEGQSWRGNGKSIFSWWVNFYKSC